MAQRLPITPEKPSMSGIMARGKPNLGEGAKVLNKILSPIQTSTKKPLNPPAFGQSLLFKYALNHTSLKLEDKDPTEDCKCPHVIVADDDRFEHLYYQSLFQKSMDFEAVAINRENLRLQFVTSGEDLIENYCRYKQCGCGNLVLVISDYNMGEQKLNGVMTCIKVRDAGYKGCLLLRTSETEEFLKATHKDFDQLCEQKIIDAVVNKTDGKNGKEVIQRYLEEASKTIKARKQV